MLSPYEKSRVLVIEDEPRLCQAIVDFLRLEGCHAVGVNSLQNAELWLTNQACDILIIDSGLPDGDGLEWLRSNPALTGKGIIITSTVDESYHRLYGLKAGADVYLVKPVQLEILAATIANLQRRLKPQAPSSWKFQRSDWILVSPNGLALKLTHSEFVLIEQLVRRPGHAVNKNELIAALGHDPLSYDPRRMEILIRRLRAKCQIQIGCSLPLETIYGGRYAFAARVDEVG
jgi:DNA-binding response OmpR family regulator